MNSRSAPKVSPKAAQAANPSAMQRRLEELAAANRKLGQEVIRRRAAEASLRKNERHQRQMLKNAEQVQVQMRDLSRRLLGAQEEERRRISRELHDDVLQTLVGINVQLESLNRDAQLDLARFKLKIARTQHLVTDSVKAIHRFARELRPMILDDLGLLPALRSYIADFRMRTAIVVQFTGFPEVEQLSNARRTVLFRVVQSALSNIAEHAGARRVKVSIEDEGRTVLLKIHDNGRAFDVERTLHARRYKRLGLLGMRERVEMVGGNFEIVSAPGRGTTVRAEIPHGSEHAKKGRRPKAARPLPK